MAKEGFVLMARVVGGKQQVQQFPVSRQKFFEGDGWAVHTPEAPAEPPAKKEAKQEPKPEPKQPK